MRRRNDRIPIHFLSRPRRIPAYHASLRALRMHYRNVRVKYVALKIICLPVMHIKMSDDHLAQKMITIVGAPDAPCGSHRLSVATLR